MNAKGYRRLFLALLACLGASLLLNRGRSREEELPRHVVNQHNGWAESNTCYDCHVEVDGFVGTGHGETLQPAGSEVSLKLLRQIASSPALQDKGIQIEERGDEVYAIHTDQQGTQEIRLDWCFGSGLHARTWVGTLGDSWGATDQVEFRWTWYNHLDDFGLTPGQPEEQMPGYFGHLGVLYDHPKTRRCFACHTTRLPIDEGRIDFSHMVTGIQCQRCHGPQEKHVQSEGEISEHSWVGIDHVESVNRCAQCHRRAEELEDEQIHPDNSFLARFQPIGLTNSACFNSEKMTCMTCHDPHLPLAKQKLDGIWQCTQCHDGTAENYGLCGAGQLDDCMSCHMPKIKDETPLLFTDHWIRVRSDKGEIHDKKDE
ncbi:MAG: hypothetical protein JKY95_12470 [Planctomycetaceae bacterium]|nr:hypothetical protein [Planctomycetaceae bacterium]